MDGRSLHQKPRTPNPYNRLHAEDAVEALSGALTTRDSGETAGDSVIADAATAGSEAQLGLFACMHLRGTRQTPHPNRLHAEDAVEALSGALPTGPNPLYGPASRHGSLNSLFLVALHLPSFRQTPHPNRLHAEDAVEALSEALPAVSASAGQLGSSLTRVSAENPHPPTPQPPHLPENYGWGSEFLMKRERD